MIAFLLGYWKPLAILALVMLVYAGGYRAGHNSAEVHYRAEIDEANAAMIKVQEAIEEQSAKKSAEYQAWAAKQRAALTAVNRRLQDEIIKNSALRDCVASADFVRTYNAATGHTDNPPAR